MMAYEERNSYLDFVRGIAIILVVAGHSIQFGSTNENWITNRLYFDNTIYQLIYSFHMPLFMLLSGYLFYFSVYKRSFWQNLVKKMRSTITPMLFWTFVGVFIPDLIMGGILETLKTFVRSFAFNYWFLWAVFFCSLIILCLCKTKKLKYAIYIILMILTLFTPDKYGLYLHKFVFPYFLIGFMWNQFRCSKRFAETSTKLRVFIWIFLIATFVILFFGYSRDNLIYTSRITLLYTDNLLKQMQIDLHRWIIGFVGAAAILVFFCIIAKDQNRVYYKTISRIGRNTIGIYLISTIIFQNNFLIHTQNEIEHVFVVINTIIITLVCWLLSEIVAEHSLLNKIMLGGR